MMLDESPQLAGWTIDQLGTDLSRPALERARSGRFTQIEVRS
jgi:chemotaxis methyl-accepting protein methylase